MKFTDLNIGKPLNNALIDLGLETPTPIQSESFSPVMAGKDVVGIAQTGTGKTFAYLLPILRGLKYSEQKHPRVLILVPTRELVVQLAEEINKLTAYMTVRVKAVYGGTNINTQKQDVHEGSDIVVATPGRLLDLALSGVLRLKKVQQIVIDEVDEMLDLGFRTQLINLFDILPQRRQNLMFSATMTEDVEEIIGQFFFEPEKIEIAPSGSTVDHIEQFAYHLPNFNTKFNLLDHLILEDKLGTKNLIFVETKKLADSLYERLIELLNLPPDSEEIGIMHSNKSQNFRLRTVEHFNEGKSKYLIATDIVGRGIDFEGVTHVVNFDIPKAVEHYIHRIGRTGRAGAEGTAISFVRELEEDSFAQIKDVLKGNISNLEMEDQVEISEVYTEEERPNLGDINYLAENTRHGVKGEVHEKKDKNKKVNLGGSYKRKIKEKYKKPKTRGQKRKK